MPESYYQPSSKPSLFDQALGTAVRGVAGQLVGRFLDEVPDDVAFEVQNQKSQINSIERGKVDASTSLKLIETQIQGLHNISRSDAFSDKDMLADSYAQIETSLAALMDEKAGNYQYYDIQNKDEFGNPQLKTGFSPAIAKQAGLVKQIYESHKPIYDQTNMVTQNFIDLNERIAAVRKKGDSGFYHYDDDDGSKDKGLLKVLEDMEKLTTSNIIVNGQRIIPIDSMRKKTDKLTDWVRAVASAERADWDKKAAGIQVASEIIVNPYEKGTKEWEKTEKDQVFLKELFGMNIDIGTLDDNLREEIVNDMKSTGTMKSYDGTQNITYENAAYMVEKYFQDGEPAKAQVLLDRMLPDQNKLERMKEIEAVKRVDKSISIQQAAQIQATASKQRTHLKASLEYQNKEKLKRINANVVISKEANNDIWHKASSLFGKKYDMVGKEEDTRFFGVFGTDEWMIDKDLIPFANLVVPYLNHYNSDSKWSSTTANPEINGFNIQKGRQIKSAKSLLEAYAHVNTLADHIIAVDGDGNKTTVMKKDINAMSDALAYSTVKNSKEYGGILWHLGLGAGDEGIDEKERFARMDDRSSKLTGNIPEGKPTTFTSAVMKGREGKLLTEIAKHWKGHEDRLDKVASPEKMKNMKENVEQLKFLESVLHGDYNAFNKISAAQLEQLDEMAKQNQLSNGEATLGADGTITTKLKISKKDKQNVANAIASGDTALSHTATFTNEGVTTPTTEYDIIDQMSDQEFEDYMSLPDEWTTPATQTQDEINKALTNIGTDVLLSNVGKKKTSAKEIEDIEIDWNNVDWGEEDIDEATDKVVSNKSLLATLDKVENVDVKPSKGLAQKKLNDLEIASIVPDASPQLIDRGEHIVKDVGGEQRWYLSGEGGALAMGDYLAEDLSKIENIKNNLVEYRSKGDQYNIKKSVEAIDELENKIKEKLGKHINPDTGLLSDERTTKNLYDLLKTVFPNKSMSELQDMLRQYSTAKTKASSLPFILDELEKKRASRFAKVG